MIADHDRSKWFGASDTYSIMGNWETKTFRNWWAAKLGIRTSNYATVAMNAGTYYEHAILAAIGAPRTDHQIIIPELSLRVNLDGDGPGEIYEVKTYKADTTFKVKKQYWQQVQVQIYAKMKEDNTEILPTATVVSYGLFPEDYKNFFLPVDNARIGFHEVEYDPDFVDMYLNRLRYLKKCLDDRRWPHESDI